MSEQDNKQMGRRQFMRIAGASVVGVSLTGLTACSGGESSSTAPAAKPDSAPAPKPAAPAPAATAPKPAPAPAPAPAAPTAAVRVAESDAQATALGYKHNAAEVDLTMYPARGEAAAANHYCKNCLLFQGKDGDEWGPCSIFGGKLVNANGWCATYAPKAS